MHVLQLCVRSTVHATHPTTAAVVLLHVQVLFTAELNRRLAAANIPVDALSLHPGNVLTDVVRSLPPLLRRLYKALLTNILFTPQEGESVGTDGGAGMEATHTHTQTQLARCCCCVGHSSSHLQVQPFECASGCHLCRIIGNSYLNM